MHTTDYPLGNYQTLVLPRLNNYDHVQVNPHPGWSNPDF